MSWRVVGATGLFASSAALVFATVAMAIEDETEAAPIVYDPLATCPAFPTTTVAPTTTSSSSTSSPSTGTTVPGSGGTTIPGGGGTTTTECACPD